MAGHGSQQPDKGEKDDYEPDGFDEIFLPTDASNWSPGAKEVTNALTDDEIRRAIEPIAAAGAAVAVVFDSCQSGTMMRGLERYRQIPMEEIVPSAEVDAARRRSRGAETPEHLLGLSDSEGRIAALYAAQMNEPTPEKRMPDETGKVHGLFTYTIASILASSPAALTYRELGLRVVEQYRALNRPGPTPMFEGSGLDREVLGQRAWTDRPDLIVGSQNPRTGEFDLRSGHVHGLTPGTILEVFPPAGVPLSENALGLLRILAVESTSATARVVARDEAGEFHPVLPVPQPFPTASRARVLYYDYGDFRLKVAVQRNSGLEGSVVGAVGGKIGMAPIERALDVLETATSGLATRTDSGDDADWVSRADHDGVFVLTPAAEWRSSPRSLLEDDVPVFRVGLPSDPDLAARLTATVRAVARVQNLLRMATVRQASAGVALDIDLLSRPAGAVPFPMQFETSVPELRIGDRILARIRNSGSEPIDVTLLSVDSRYNIEALFPAAGLADNRLSPGEFRDVAIDVGEPAGTDNLVAIAVAAQGPQVSLTHLAQAPLQRVEARGPTRTATTPFEALLDAAMYGGTRGKTTTARSHVVRILTFRTRQP